MELDIIGSICLICMTLIEIFRRKYKRDMFIEYLKHDDTTTISDDIIANLFDLYEDE